MIRNLKYSDVEGTRKKRGNIKSSVEWNELMGVLHSTFKLPDIKEVVCENGTSNKSVAKYGKTYAEEHGLPYSVEVYGKKSVLVIPKE